MEQLKKNRRSFPKGYYHCFSVDGNKLAFTTIKYVSSSLNIKFPDESIQVLPQKSVINTLLWASDQDLIFGEILKGEQEDATISQISTSLGMKKNITIVSGTYSLAWTHRSQKISLLRMDVNGKGLFTINVANAMIHKNADFNFGFNLLDISIGEGHAWLPDQSSIIVVGRLLEHDFQTQTLPSENQWLNSFKEGFFDEILVETNTGMKSWYEYIKDKSARERLYIISKDKTVTPIPESLGAFKPLCSHDGSCIIFQRRETYSRNSIWMVQFPDLDIKKIGDCSSSHDPILHPDNTLYYYPPENDEETIMSGSGNIWLAVELLK